MISNKPSQNKKYRKCIKARSEGELPLLFDDQLLKIDKKKSIDDKIDDIFILLLLFICYDKNIILFLYILTKSNHFSFLNY